ncbi:hypothetical protein [Streptomyces sp. G1]|uniref:hypothetical protein n=1 Tax=Streptomyces sp. G1 TaxID=361572 RepID=UPI0035AB999B
MGPPVATPYWGSIAMLPVAQLYVRDVPGLPTPEGADLLQVLWCPFDHPMMPRTKLFWRSAASVTDILDTPPDPPVTQFDGYVPEPCLLRPEQVTEYPDHLELSKELRGQIENWSPWEIAEEGECPWFAHGEPDGQPPAGFDPVTPTAVQIGRGHAQQLYVCPAAPEHPHIELMH